MAVAELSYKRTATAKHFLDLDTGQQILVSTIHDQHYRDETGTWQETSEVYEPGTLPGFGHKADKMRHALHTADDGVRRWYPRRNVDEYFGLTEITYRFAAGDWRPLPDLGTPTWNLGTATWTKPNYSLSMAVNWHKVKFQLVLNNSTVAKPIRCGVTLHGLTYDHATSALTSTTDGIVVGWVDKPVGWDANGSALNHNIPVSTTYSGGYITFTADLTGAQYPVTIDPTLTLQPNPTDGIDTTVVEAIPDADWYATAVAIHVAGGAGNRQNALFNFDLSSIPGGATIDSGTFTLWNEAQITASSTDTANIILAANTAWVETARWNHLDGAGGTHWAGDVGADHGSDAGCSVSGADYSGTALGTISPVLNDAIDTQYDMVLDATELATMVANNYGFICRRTSGSNNGIDYRSSDYTDDTTKRPKLVVVYTEAGGTVRNLMLLGVG